MRKIYIYIFLVLFSIGSAQAGTHYCVTMDVQDNSNTGMSDDQASCHFQSEEPASNDKSDNSCCDESCDSCASVVVTFNSLKSDYEFAYAEQYKQYGSFFILSNHIKIPTPPPNS